MSTYVVPSYDRMVRESYPKLLTALRDVVDRIAARNALPDKGEQEQVGGTLTIEQIRSRDPAMLVGLPRLVLIDALAGLLRTKETSGERVELEGIIDDAPTRAQLSCVLVDAYAVLGAELEHTVDLIAVLRFKLTSDMESWPPQRGCRGFTQQTHNEKISRLAKRLSKMTEDCLRDEIPALLEYILEKA